MVYFTQLWTHIKLDHGVSPIEMLNGLHSLFYHMKGFDLRVSSMGGSQDTIVLAGCGTPMATGSLPHICTVIVNIHLLYLQP